LYAADSRVDEFLMGASTLPAPGGSQGMLASK
jgi:hypothetical protein